MYIIELTAEERECIITALMLLKADGETTESGSLLANQLLCKIL